MGKRNKSSDANPSHSGVIAYRIRENVSEVLLVTSTGSGRWVIPKGHILEVVGGRESARREAFEEAGLEGEVELEPFHRYTHGDDDAVVDVYLMRVTREFESWPEEDVRERRWVPLAEADSFVEDDGLSKMFRKVANARLDPRRKTKKVDRRGEAPR
ncbi:MAG TPA: NUDIX hydrolase [Gemmatimonadaceae bacterium]|nr:NUDIX hydrolase [Gemmatimonadaceae bacterium]